MGESRLCQSCGEGVRVSSRFCPHCGAGLARRPRTVPGVARDWITSRPPTSSFPAQSSVPPPRHSLLASRRAGERRLVTIVFADVVGFTQMSERLDPEVLTAVINRLFEAMRRVVERYEGTVDKFIGDAAMLLFGAPTAHEDDAERAIRTATDILAAIDDVAASCRDDFGFEERLQVHIGVASGMVIAGEVGGSYTVMGDAVNVASRLVDNAPAGQIWIDEATLSLLRKRGSTPFEILPGGAVQLKGRAKPVDVFRVEASTGADEDEAPFLDIPFVAREKPLSQLGEATGALAEGRGGALWLVGPAGVGKSRLVREALDRLPKGVRVHRGSCSSFGRHQPFHAWAEVLRRLMKGARIDPYARDLVRSVTRGRLQSAEAEGDEHRRLLLAAAQSVIIAACERRPRVVVIDDVQWSDASSRELLERLVPLTERLPLLLLALGREAPTIDVDALSLEPLGDDDARRMVDTAVAPVAGFKPELRRHIAERSEGLPLFIVETLRGYWDAGLVKSGPTGPRLSPSAEADVAVPSSLHAMIAARIDRLSPTDRHRLELASLLGREFNATLVDAITGGEFDAAAWERLEQAGEVRKSRHPNQRRVSDAGRAREERHSDPGLADDASNPGRRSRPGRITQPSLSASDLAPTSERWPSEEPPSTRASGWFLARGPHYRFANGLTQEVVYKTLLQRRRQELHGRVAAVLSQRGWGAPPHVLAHHHAAAGQPELAAPHFARAAESARHVGANEEALDLVTAGLSDDLPPDSPHRLELLVLQSQLATELARYRVASAALDQRIRIARDAGHLVSEADALTERALVAARMGDLSGITKHAAQALDRAEQSGNAMCQARALKAVGISHEFTGRFADAEAAYHELVDRVGGADPHLEASSYDALGQLAAASERFEDALFWYDRAARLTADLDESIATRLARRSLQAAANLQLDHVDRARDELDDVIVERRRLGQLSLLAADLVHRGTIALQQGDLDIALDCATEAWRHARRGAEREMAARALRLLAQLAAQDISIELDGVPTRPDAMLEESIRRFTAMGKRVEEARSHELLAALVEADDVERALRARARAAELYAQLGLTPLATRALQMS